MKKICIVLLFILASCVSKHLDSKKEDKVRPKKPAIKKNKMSKKPSLKDKMEKAVKRMSKVIKKALIKHNLLGEYGLKKGDEFTVVLKQNKGFIKKADGTMILISKKTGDKLNAIPEVRKEIYKIMASAERRNNPRKYKKPEMVIKEALLKYNLLGDYGLKSGDSYEVVFKGKKAFIKRVNGMIPITEKTMKELRKRGVFKKK